MYIAPSDRSLGESEWLPFLRSQGFGHFVAQGRDRRYPVIVPTQFIVDEQRLVTHFAAPNPVLQALEENSDAMMSVAGDWSFIPSSWKAIGDEDPSLGIPTTYYAAVQLEGRAEVLSGVEDIAGLLRLQLGEAQPEISVADPLEAHRTKLRSIRGVILHIENVRAKFKYGGNVDGEHRRAVISRLDQRDGPGDRKAAQHTARRLNSES